MKINFVVLLLLIVGCVEAQKNETLVKALTDTSLIIRGNVITVPNAQFRYDYYDVNESDSDVQHLQDRGYQGGGPSWRGIVYGAVTLSDPKILSKIRFDEEGDGLAIWSDDKEILNQIGRLVSAVKADAKLLDACISVAESSLEME